MVCLPEKPEEVVVLLLRLWGRDSGTHRTLNTPTSSACGARYTPGRRFQLQFEKITEIPALAAGGVVWTSRVETVAAIVLIEGKPKVHQDEPASAAFKAPDQSRAISTVEADLRRRNNRNIRHGELRAVRIRVAVGLRSS